MPAIFHDTSVPENYIVVGGVRQSFGAQTVAVREENSAYTVTVNDHVILGDASGGAITITLPPAATGKFIFHIKKIDATGNAVTIDGDGSETIDGATTQTITTQYNSIMLVSDLTEWWII